METDEGKPVDDQTEFFVSDIMPHSHHTHHGSRHTLASKDASQRHLGDVLVPIASGPNMPYTPEDDVVDGSVPGPYGYIQPADMGESHHSQGNIQQEILSETTPLTRGLDKS